MLNPTQMISMIINNSQAMQNPVMRNAYDMYQKQDTNGLKNLAENVAREKGINLDEFRKQIGI